MARGKDKMFGPFQGEVEILLDQVPGIADELREPTIARLCVKIVEMI